jgi:hypothetical protein
MRNANKRPGIGGKASALLCAVLLTSLAHAAPDCIVTANGTSFNAGPVLDKDHGYCVTQEIIVNESDNKWLAHTTYESGKVVDRVIAVNDQKNAWFETKQEGKSGYVSYGLDAWPEDEYTSYLPKPSIPAFMVSLTHGKDKRTGEWSFSALFVDKQGKAQDGMRTYIGQLKTIGFMGDADEYAPKSGGNGSSPEAIALLAYSGRNNAGFLARVLCMGTRLCHVRLDNPRKAQRETSEKASRKAREEKKRRRTQKVTDDFVDFVNSLPDE